mgnify:CR=1 FL=1
MVVCPIITFLVFLFIKTHTGYDLIDLFVYNFFIHCQYPAVLHGDLSINDHGLHLRTICRIGKTCKQVISGCQGRRIQVQNGNICLFAYFQGSLMH